MPVIPAERSRVQGQSWLHSMLKTNLNYMKLLKQNQKPKNKVPRVHSQPVLSSFLFFTPAHPLLTLWAEICSKSVECAPLHAVVCLEGYNKTLQTKQLVNKRSLLLTVLWAGKSKVRGQQMWCVMRTWYLAHRWYLLAVSLSSGEGCLSSPL